MPRTVPSKFWLMALAPVSVAIAAIAWSGHKSKNELPHQIIQDTISLREKSTSIKNLQKADKNSDTAKPESLGISIQKLRGELRKTRSAMQQAKKNTDFIVVNREVEASLDKIESHLRSEPFRELIRDEANRSDTSRY